MGRLLRSLGVITFLLTAQQTLAATTSPGANAVFSSVQASSLTTGGGGTTLTTARLNNAKANKVLTVRVMLATNDTGNVQEIIAYATVNGSFVLEPISNVGTYCEDVYSCTLVGTFWIDINTLDAQSGGGVIGHPLTVALIGQGVYPLSGALTSQVNGSLEIRLETK